MKKKICCLLAEMMIIIVLLCACSVRQKTEAVLGIVGFVPMESVALEALDAGRDNAVDMTIALDLNNNGVAEEVRLMDIDGGQGQRLEIWENKELIYFEEGFFTSSGWWNNRQTSIFLCTLDGEDYLLCYEPTIYQGVCMYYYELYTLADNKKAVVQRNSVDFDINFRFPVYNGFDAEAIAVFMDEINELLSHSVQMLNTNSNLIYTFEKEGRLHDSLWWLDGWEMIFNRDKNKSLLENLENFKTAMTAHYEPIVLEDVGGLPISEPLEMKFYSGAGAWWNSFILYPDGSFVGDYVDANVFIRYVCQYHGRFGKVEKLTAASWLLTLEELEIDTRHNVGEEWDELDGDYTIHYISSEPYGLEDADGAALRSGAQFILYSPEATGHEPGTELYGEMEFQSWMHKYHEFNNSDDILGCWGLQNIETGQGFYSDSN